MKDIKTKNIFAFDIETYDLSNDFLMGSIYGEYRNTRNKQNFTTIINRVFWNRLEFIDYILNKLIFYDNTYIIATNLGFDFMALFENTNILPDFLLTIRGSNILQAKYKDKEGKRNVVIKFIDSMNFSKLSVKEMGNMIGLEKLPTPVCFKRKPKNLAEKIELETYNKMDTRITFEFMKMLQKGFNDLNCCMKMTIASTSMDLFKRNYLDRTLFQNENTIKTLLKGYYGARTEVLKRGKIDYLGLKYYDYNSLYPDVMRNKYPNPNYEIYIKKGNYNLLENNKYEGLMNVTIKINKDIELPYLPYRKFNNKEKTGSYKLIFPTGIFSGYYTFYELRKALKLGYEILEFGECVYYTKTFKPFEKYVNTLYPKKLEYKKEKSPLEQVVKLHLNSLYGKFAQKYDNNEQIYHINSLTGKQFSDFIHKRDIYKTIVRGNYIYVTRKKATYIPTFIIPIFSIYTTSFARTKLYEKIIDIGVDSVYYYDTDSIITDKILNTSNKLGELKLEYFILEGKIVAPKVYSFKTDTKELIKVKGIPRLKNQEEFNGLIETKKAVYEKFVKFKEANSRNLKYNQIIMVEKNFKFEDDKRIWREKFFMPERLQDSFPIHILEKNI